jgi:hypothetical protein
LAEPPAFPGETDGLADENHNHRQDEPCGRQPPPEDLDFAPLEDLFREELFKVLLKREKITPERVDLLRSLRTAVSAWIQAAGFLKTTTTH